MTDAYRALATVEDYSEKLPVGLVRRSGVRRSGCSCAPPGPIWTWWYSVQRGDRWYCKHHEGWEWSAAVTADPGFYDRWKAVKAK